MRYATGISLALALIAWLFSCSGAHVEPLPSDGEAERSFQANILPLLDDYRCTDCHGERAGLSVETLDGLLEGGDHGPAILPGHADGSLLIQKLSAAPPFGSRMPLRGPYLPDSVVSVLKQWINEQAPAH